MLHQSHISTTASAKSAPIKVTAVPAKPASATETITIVAVAVFGLVVLVAVLVLVVRSYSKRRINEIPDVQIPLLTSMTMTPNTHADINSEDSRENLLAATTIREGAALVHGDMDSAFDDENTFVLIAVDANTLKAARAAVFNINNVATMITFVTSLGKNEVVMVASRQSFPREWSPRAVDVLRSLRSVSGSLHALGSSPFVPTGARRPYLVRGLVHGDHRPGRAGATVDLALPSPLETVSITASMTSAMSPRASHQHPSNDEQMVLRDMTAEVRHRQTQAIVSSFRDAAGVILVITDTQWHLGIDGDVFGVTGYTARQFLASNPTMRDFQSPDVDRAEVASFLATVVDPNLTFVEVNIPHVHKQGHTIWLRARRGTRVIGTAANGNPEVLVVFSCLLYTSPSPRD